MDDYLVIYAVIRWDKENGAWVDTPQFGGVRPTKAEAEDLAREIAANDHKWASVHKKQTSGLIVRIFDVRDSALAALDRAIRWFADMERDIYGAEELYSMNSKRGSIMRNLSPHRAERGVEYAESS